MSEADAWESNSDIQDDDETGVSFRPQVKQTVKIDTSDIARLTPAQAQAFGDAVKANTNTTVRLKEDK